MQLDMDKKLADERSQRQLATTGLREGRATLEGQVAALTRQLDAMHARLHAVAARVRRGSGGLAGFFARLLCASAPSDADEEELEMEEASDATRMLPAGPATVLN